MEKQNPALRERIDEGDLTESINTSKDAIIGLEFGDFSDIVKMVCEDFGVDPPDFDLPTEMGLRAYIRNQPDATYRGDTVDESYDF